MGILTDALAIIFGCVFGGRLQKNSNDKIYNTLGIGIIIISLVGFFENIYNIKGETIVSGNLMIVLFSYFFGSVVGDKLRLEERLSHISKTDNKSFNAFIDAFIFFGIGGLQISGPLLLGLNNDNSQLFIKSLVDIPFAIAFGAAYGKIAALAAIPVALIQIVIALIAYFFSFAISGELSAQLCSMGYIILFFSGFNLVTNGKYRVNNVNMLPGIIIVILLNIIVNFAERF